MCTRIAFTTCNRSYPALLASCATTTRAMARAYSCAIHLLARTRAAPLPHEGNAPDSVRCQHAPVGIVCNARMRRSMQCINDHRGKSACLKHQGFRSLTVAVYVHWWYMARIHSRAQTSSRAPAMVLPHLLILFPPPYSARLFPAMLVCECGQHQKHHRGSMLYMYQHRAFSSKATWQVDPSSTPSSCAVLC